MSAPGGSRGHGWSRRAFVVGWVAAFALMATAVAWSWDRLVGVLARTPTPAVAAAPRSTGTGATGARELAEARRLLDQGDAIAALAVLEQVRPEEPEYPLARRLRDQAEGVLRASTVPPTRGPGGER